MYVLIRLTRICTLYNRGTSNFRRLFNFYLHTDCVCAILCILNDVGDRGEQSNPANTKNYVKNIARFLYAAAQVI